MARRRFRPEELQKLLQLHELWVRGKGGLRADLHDTDLRSVQVPEAWLEHLDLGCADLRDSYREQSASASRAIPSPGGIYSRFRKCLQHSRPSKKQR